MKRNSTYSVKWTAKAVIIVSDSHRKEKRFNYSALLPMMKSCILSLPPKLNDMDN
ncbi:hypothetical protein [Phocaeicola sp.]